MSNGNDEQRDAQPRSIAALEFSSRHSGSCIKPNLAQREQDQLAGLQSEYSYEKRVDGRENRVMILRGVLQIQIGLQGRLNFRHRLDRIERAVAIEAAIAVGHRPKRDQQECESDRDHRAGWRRRLRVAWPARLKDFRRLRRLRIQCSGRPNPLADVEERDTMFDCPCG